MFNIKTPAQQFSIQKKLKQKAIVVGGALALLAVCAWATDPWKNADYEKWSAKDVDKILNNSPWAKIISVPYSPYLNGDRMETDQHLKIGQTSTQTDAAGEMLYHPVETYTLRWNSALTLRRALYREAVLKGLGTDYAAQTYLTNDQDNMDLVMIATGQTFLPPTEAAALRQETYLELKPSGQKIYTVTAEVRTDVDARDHRGYFFSFPQRLKDGTPAIPKDVTEIVFFTQVGVRIFQAKFRPAEMLLDKRPDYF